MEYFQHGLIFGILHVVCDPCEWCNIHGVITGCCGMFTRAISAINWVNRFIYNRKQILTENNDYYPCTIQCKSDRGIFCQEVLEGNATFMYAEAPSPIPTSVPVASPISVASLSPCVAPSISPSPTPSFSAVLPPSSAPTTPPTVSPTKLPSESPTRRPTNEPVFSITDILCDFVDSSDVEVKSLELLNSLGVDIDNDGSGDNDTYYFIQMEFISQIKIDSNTQQKVNLFEHDLNDVSINITWLINNKSNTTQAFIADGYAILYNNKSLLITDPDDDYSHGNYTIESYLVIYSRKSINKYSQSICDTFDESVFKSGNTYSIGIEIEISWQSESIIKDLIADSPAVGGECIISPDYSERAFFDEFNVACY